MQTPEVPRIPQPSETLQPPESPQPTNQHEGGEQPTQQPHDENPHEPRQPPPKKQRRQIQSELGFVPHIANPFKDVDVDPMKVVFDPKVSGMLKNDQRAKDKDGKEKKDENGNLIIKKKGIITLYNEIEGLPNIDLEEIQRVHCCCARRPHPG